MAMDKEKLLTHFQERYLSRQEVLFMLPLNYSIDSFWPELLNRRKARAVLLPLFNASGMPYWYVLTPGMISASERLCEEAIGQDAGFDPYRAGMTSAMTEEMFFTSYVEGAQIPLQEAMDFLSRGTEPESIQEQMIWNNRHAWSEMVRGLYHPLDESFVRGLAYMLTEEMDGCAEDYRQADNHPIAAMQNESYDVLPARSIPERMQQYYAFLQDPGVHPLIKAAAAQAYLLVARPFPEGNERLSRMLSSAVLMRCGYDFFRDISVSSVIARENYLYYKSMREIIRSENGGDLTYFIEYYLGLLVRALNFRDERIRRREQEEREREQERLEKEREAARQPLQAVMPATVETKPDTDEKTVQGNPPNEYDDRLVVGEHMPMDKYIGLVDRLKHSPSERVRQIPQTVRSLIKAGILTFTIRQWSEYSGLPNEASDQQCRIMFSKELLDRDKRGKTMTYTFRVIVPSPDGHPAQEETEENQGHARTEMTSEMPEDLSIRLNIMKLSRYDTLRQSAETICRLFDQRQIIFARRDFSALSGLNNQQADRACDTMVRLGIIRNRWPGRKPTFYEINLDHVEEEPLSPEIIQQLHVMKDSRESERDNRIGEFLLNLIKNGRRKFTSSDWEEAFHQSNFVFGEDIRTAINLGLIRKEQTQTIEMRCIYSICSKRSEKIHADDLTQTQKNRLSRLYEAFKTKEFTAEDCAGILGNTDSAARTHLNAFCVRGILRVQQHQGKASTFSFVTTPAKNPECFEATSVSAVSGRQVPVAASGARRSTAIAV